MNEPIQVPSSGEPEWQGEITESKLDQVIGGLLIPNQAFSKAMARALRQRDERIVELEKALRKIDMLAESSELIDSFPAVTAKTLRPIIREALEAK